MPELTRLHIGGEDIPLELLVLISVNGDSLELRFAEGASMILTGNNAEEFGAWLRQLQRVCA